MSTFCAETPNTQSSPLPVDAGDDLGNLGLTIRRRFVDAFFEREVAGIPAASLVLDLGGTRDTKRGLFDIGRFPLRVVCANLSPVKGADILANAVHLPHPAEIFDAVICAEVLEHVPQPAAVVCEAHRVLRPGGTLLITAPFLYRIHADPHDHGRYTDHHWRWLLGELGFTDIRIERHGHLPLVLLDMFRLWALELTKEGRPRGRIRRWLMHRSLRWWTRRALALETDPETLNSAFQASFTTGFGVVAKRDH